jgi:WD40 repeat protein
MLLACTRDRQVLIFKRKEELNFELYKRIKEAHTRIIWALNWSHDDKLFATASRENKRSVKIWNCDGNEQHSEIPQGKVPCATSIQFFPELVNNQYSLVIGLETGQMSIW